MATAAPALAKTSEQDLATERLTLATTRHLGIEVSLAPFAAARDAQQLASPP
jgi:hypothetical protein